MTLKAIFVYTDHLGRPVLRKVRGDRKGNGKDFHVEAARYKAHRLYWKPGRSCVERWQPDWADRVIYNLPLVLAALQAGEPVWICEGERDCDTLSSVARVAATTTHQGIEQMGPLQARWFVRGKSRINIVMDGDDAGAFGAWGRYMALLDAGVGKKRLRLWRPAEGFKDVTEAVAEVGLRRAFVRAKRGPTRKAAMRYGTARAAGLADYRSGHPHPDYKGRSA
jgi:hypothetical protein